MTAEIWYLLFNDKKALLGSPLSAEATNIGGLKKAVKEELENVKARDLVVWRCKEPLLSTQPRKALQQCLSKIDFLDEEQVVELASGVDLADLELGSKEVLLVQVPDAISKFPSSRSGLHSLDLSSKKQHLKEKNLLNEFHQARMHEISAALRALKVSSAAEVGNFSRGQKKLPVLNGRPIDCHAEPVGLYHPVFNEFQDAMANPECSCNDVATYGAVRSIFDVFSRIYDDEKQRVEQIKEHLEALLGRKLTVAVEKGVVSDGVMNQPCYQSTAYLLIQEVKNEIGTGHSDPYNQASLAYRKYWAGEKNLVPYSYCPSIILAIAGPWMCVLGGVFVEKTITQPLTDYVWLGGDPFDSTRQVFAVRLFTALKSAISSLDKYYKALGQNLWSLTAKTTVSPFPFITEYGAEKIKFTYSSRLVSEYRYKLLFKARLDDMHNTQVVVKFAERYNVEAHRLLAAEDLAPKLRYSSTDNNIRYGKRWMIVMDYVDLEPLSDCLTEAQYKRVKKAIEILHSSNMVFGDLRPPNILVGGNTAMLIDFDWCGEAGKGRYPPEINPDESIGWHPDVGPNCLMSPDHDIHMLEKLVN